MRILQPSFAAGEISPRLYGRVDLAKYQTGLALCRNFVPVIYGGVQNRPGSRFVAETKNNAAVRLIPFQFSASDTVLIEAGAGYMRFHVNGAPVMSGGAPYEIATPYTADDLQRLNYAQSFDVMTLVHKSYPIYELRRFGATNWQLSVATIGPSEPAPAITAQYIGEEAAEYTYSYAAVAVNKATGLRSYASNAANVNGYRQLDFSNHIIITITNYDPNYQYDFYKLRNGVYGYIGTASQGSTFNDDGITANLSDTILTPSNPFDGSGNWPCSATYFEQRRIYGGSANKPETVWMSRTSDYTNFASSTPVKDDDAITLTIANGTLADVRHVISLRSLLVFTGSVIAVIERGDSGLTPSLEGGIRTDLQLGCGYVAPLKVGRAVIFLDDSGKIVRDLLYDFSADGFLDGELSLLSQHLLEEQTVVDWTVAVKPNSTIWMVRSDGCLLSLSYLKAHDVTGWGWHDTQGRFEAVCSIREGDEDAVYVCVRRRINDTVKRFIERFATRQVADMRDAFFLDCGLSYDDPIQLTGVSLDGQMTITLPSASLATGDLVELSGFEGSNINDQRCRVQLVSGSTYALYREFASDGSANLNPEDAIQGSAVTSWGEVFVYVRKCVSTVTGLDHLNGMTVGILADGSVENDQVVSNGALTFDRKYARIHVGLRFTSDMQTLPISGDAEVVGKTKRVVGLKIKANFTRGLFSGSSFDEADLYELRPDPPTDWGQVLPALSGMIEMPMAGSWSDDGKVCVRQVDPLPAEILAVIPDLEFSNG